MGGSVSRHLWPSSHFISIEDAFKLCTPDEIEAYIRLFYKSIKNQSVPRFLEQSLSAAQSVRASPTLHRLFLAAAIFTNEDGVCLLDLSALQRELAKSSPAVETALAPLLSQQALKAKFTEKDYEIPTMTEPEFVACLNQRMIPVEISKRLYRAACQSLTDVYQARKETSLFTNKELAQIATEEKEMMKLYAMTEAFESQLRAKQSGEEHGVKNERTSAGDNTSTAQSENLFQDIEPYLLTLLASRRRVKHVIRIANEHLQSEKRELLTFNHLTALTCEGFVTFCAAMSGTRRIPSVKQRFFRANVIYATYANEFGLHSEDFTAFKEFVTGSRYGPPPSRKYPEWTCISPSCLESLLRFTFLGDAKRSETPINYTDSYALVRGESSVYTRRLTRSELRREILDVSKVIAYWYGGSEKSSTQASLQDVFTAVYDSTARATFIREKTPAQPSSAETEEPPIIHYRCCYQHHPGWAEFHRWASTHSQSPILMPSFHGLLLGTSDVSATLSKVSPQAVATTSSALVASLEQKRLAMLSSTLGIDFAPTSTATDPEGRVAEIMTITDRRLTAHVGKSVTASSYLLSKLTTTELAALARDVAGLDSTSDTSLTSQLVQMLTVFCKGAAQGCTQKSSEDLAKAVNAFVHAVDYLDPVPTSGLAQPAKLGTVLATTLLLRPGKNESGPDAILRLVHESREEKYDPTSEQGVVAALASLAAMLSLPCVVLNAIFASRGSSDVVIRNWPGLAPTSTRSNAQIILEALQASASVTRDFVHNQLSNADLDCSASQKSLALSMEIPAGLLSAEWLREYAIATFGTPRAFELLYRVVYPVPLEDAESSIDFTALPNPDQQVVVPVGPIDNSCFLARSEGVLPANLFDPEPFKRAEVSSPYYYFAHTLRPNALLLLPGNGRAEPGEAQFTLISPLSFAVLRAWFRGGPVVERPLRISPLKASKPSSMESALEPIKVQEKSVLTWSHNQRVLCALEVHATTARVYLAPLPNALPAPPPPGLDFVTNRSGPIDSDYEGRSKEGAKATSEGEPTSSSQAIGTTATSGASGIFASSSSSPSQSPLPAATSSSDDGAIVVLPSLSIPFSRHTPLGAILPLLEAMIAPQVLPPGVLHQFNVHRKLQQGVASLSTLAAMRTWKPSKVLFKYCRIWLSVSSHCEVCCDRPELAQQPNVTYSVLLNKPVPSELTRLEGSGQLGARTAPTTIASMTLGEAVARLHVGARERVSAFMRAAMQGMEPAAAQAIAQSAAKQRQTEVMLGQFNVFQDLPSVEGATDPTNQPAWLSMGKCRCFFILVDRRLPYSLSDNSLADAVREALPGEAASTVARLSEEGPKGSSLPGWTPGGVRDRADVNPVFDICEGLLLPPLLDPVADGRIEPSVSPTVIDMEKSQRNSSVVTTTPTTSVVTTTPAKKPPATAVFLTPTVTSAPQLIRMESSRMVMSVSRPIGRHPLSQLSNGRTGLYNLGNTCFMNSALQALAHLPTFTEYFLFGLHRIERAYNNPQCRHQISQRYAEFIHKLYGLDVASSSNLTDITRIPLAWGAKAIASKDANGGDKRKTQRADAMTPKDLYRAVVEHYDYLGDRQQHDAQELLAVLLDAIHEGLNRRYLSPSVQQLARQNAPEYFERLDAAERSLEEVVASHSAANKAIQLAAKLKEEAAADPSKAEQARQAEEAAALVTLPTPMEEAEVSFQRYMSRNRSIVTDLFGGRFKSTLTYLRCGRQSITFDPFLMLSLPIPLAPVNAPASVASLIDPEAAEIPILVILRPPLATASRMYKNAEMGVLNQHDLSRKPVWLNVRVPTTTVATMSGITKSSCSIRSLKSCTLASLNKLDVLREDPTSPTGFTTTQSKPFAMREFQLLAVKGGAFETYLFEYASIDPSEYNAVLHSQRLSAEQADGSNRPWTKMRLLVCVQLPSPADLELEMKARRQRQGLAESSANGVISDEDPFEAELRARHRLAPRAEAQKPATIVASDDDAARDDKAYRGLQDKADEDNAQPKPQPHITLRQAIARSPVAARHLWPRAPPVVHNISSPEFFKQSVSNIQSSVVCGDGITFPDPFRGALSPGSIFDVVDTVNTWCPATVIAVRYVTPYLLAAEKVLERKRAKDQPQNELGWMMLEAKLRADAFKRLELQAMCAEIFSPKGKEEPLLLSGPTGASHVYQYSRLRDKLEEVKRKLGNNAKASQTASKTCTTEASTDDENRLLPKGLIEDEHVDFIPDGIIFKSLGVDGVGYIPAPSQEDLEIERFITHAELGQQSGIQAQAEVELTTNRSRLQRAFYQERKGVHLGVMYDEEGQMLLNRAEFRDVYKLLEAEPKSPQGWICQVRIHYVDWARKWDEWIDVSTLLNLASQAVEPQNDQLEALRKDALESRFAVASQMARLRNEWTRDKIHNYKFERAKCAESYERGDMQGAGKLRESTKQWVWEDEVDVRLGDSHLLRILHRCITAAADGPYAVAEALAGRSSPSACERVLFALPELVILPKPISSTPIPMPAQPAGGPTAEKPKLTHYWGPSTTLLDLYETVWNNASHRFAYEEGLPTLFKKGPDGRVWLPEKLPFVLVTTNHAGTTCSSCPWYKHCTGCPLLLSSAVSYSAPVETVPHPVLGQLSLVSVGPLEPLTLQQDVSLVADWDPTFAARFLNFSEAESVTVGSALAAATAASSISNGPSSLGAAYTAAILSASFGATGAQPRRKLSLFDCVAAFTSPEMLTGDNALRCSRCKQKEDCAKTLELWTAPPYLIIHLKRLLANQKLQIEVDAPITGLDITPFLARRDTAGPHVPQEFKKLAAKKKKQEESSAKSSTMVSPTASAASGISSVASAAASADSLPADLDSPLEPLDDDDDEEEEEDNSEEDVSLDETSEPDQAVDDYMSKSPDAAAQTGSSIRPVYDLISTIEHRGSAIGGHYVAKALDVRTGTWHLYDDSWVSEIDESSVVTSNSYMLFYQRRDLVRGAAGPTSAQGSTETKAVTDETLPAPKLQRSSSLGRGSSLNLFAQGKQASPPVVELLHRYLTADELSKLAPNVLDELAKRGGSSALAPGGGARGKKKYAIEEELPALADAEEPEPEAKPSGKDQDPKVSAKVSSKPKAGELPEPTASGCCAPKKDSGNGNAFDSEAFEGVSPTCTIA